VPMAVDLGKEEYFPADCFWFIQGADSKIDDRVVLRMRFDQDQVWLEIAGRDPELAEKIKEELQEISIAQSIYRGKVLQIPFEQDVPDEYGELIRPSRLNLKFMRIKEVTTEDIILSESTLQTIERNVFEFHQHRDLYSQLGIPNMRALLFHGPPGTGKTFTTQYIYNRLNGVTTFVVTGQTLHKIESVCNLARMLQPSLVILEDVDLIFTAREINLYSTALGDFMDQIDGFKADDQVIFILTTNAIKRLEKAIKDRPGRINQCVYFGPPNSSLRKRYLQRYLQPYDCCQVDLDHVVSLTQGVTQAFIKEFVHRAVMVCVQEAQFKNDVVKLTSDHFQTALDELTEKNSEHTHFIIGFRAHETDGD